MKALTKILVALLAVVMLAAPVSAAVFTPSVEQKGAPELATMKDANGNSVAAVIKDAEGKEIQGVSSKDIKVTPLSELDKAPKAVKEEITEAYKAIGKPKALDKVLDTYKENTKTENNGKLDEKTDKVNASDLVVRDVINVSLTDSASKKLMENGSSVTMGFKLGLKPGDFLMVMRFVDGEWVPMEAGKVVIQKDGTVTVEFDEDIGTIAFVVEKSED